MRIVQMIYPLLLIASPCAAQPTVASQPTTRTATPQAAEGAATQEFPLPPSELSMTFADPWHEGEPSGGRRTLLYANRPVGIMPLVSPIGESAGGVYQAARPGTATPCTRHYLDSLLERLMETEDFKGLEPAGATELIAAPGLVGVLKPMTAREGNGQFRYCGLAMFIHRGHAVTLLCVARGGRNLRREQELFREQLRSVHPADLAAGGQTQPEIVFVQAAGFDLRSPSELFGTDLEGHEAKRLTGVNMNADEPVQVADPRLSADGRWVLFASSLRGSMNLYPWAIWTMDVRSHAVRRVSGLIGNVQLVRESDVVYATVTGKVVGPSGLADEPVAGALLMAGGMARPAATDAKGDFSIQVPVRQWTWLRIDPPAPPEGKPQLLRQTARWLRPRKSGENQAGLIPLGEAGTPRPADMVLGQPASDAKGNIYWIRRLRRLGTGDPTMAPAAPWDLNANEKPIALPVGDQPAAGDPNRGWWLDESQLWRVADTGDGTVEIPATFRFWGRDASPVFSRDGRWLAVKVCRLAADVDGSSQPAFQDAAMVLLGRIGEGDAAWEFEPLAPAAAATGGLTFTPDSRELLFVAAPRAADATAGNLMAVELNGRKVRQITRWLRPAIGGVSCSPDGRLIAFDARDLPLNAKKTDPPRTDIYVVPAAGGVPTRITSNGRSSQPAWSGP